jgi:hypothetical protein
MKSIAGSVITGVMRVVASSLSMFSIDARAFAKSLALW